MIVSRVRPRSFSGAAGGGFGEGGGRGGGRGGGTPPTTMNGGCGGIGGCGGVKDGM